jgi:spermidine dehydrogenase
VDGYRLAAPQASCDSGIPESSWGVASDYWRELELPDRFEFAPREGGDPAIRFPRTTAAAMYFAEQRATIGYYFENAQTHGKGVWVKDIWADDLKRAPWPESLKQELLALRHNQTRYKDDAAEPAWLDSMSYADFVTQVMGLSPAVLSYFTPIMHILGSPKVSAYAARAFPGVARFADPTPEQRRKEAERSMSFPGGNATIARHLVKAVFPQAIQGPRTFEAIANNRVNLTALDHPGASCRMRLSATAIRVTHDADPAKSTQVSILYEKGGRLYRIKAKAAVLATGSWVNKHIVADLPDAYRTAMNQFLYAPTMIVNVALRNWRFLDRLGISAARWFDGLGFYSTVMQPMVVGRRPVPFHPDKPIVMTFYVPIQHPDLPLVAQGPAGRAELYGTSYAEYERQILAQMQRMFASAGFDARRDVAGIVLNRWGHARMVAPPGFYFGKNGAPSPLEVLRQPFGRIAFGNAEVSGSQSWPGALTQGHRAITQALAAI